MSITKAHRKLVEALYRAHLTAVREKLRQLGFSGPTLKDLEQQVFLVAVHRAEVIPANAEPWLIDVARKIAANYRKRNQHTFEELDAKAVRDALADTEDHELRDLVRRALESLHDADRELVLRHDMLGERLADLARELGLTTQGAHARLQAARRRLRAKDDD